MLNGNEFRPVNHLQDLFIWGTARESCFDGGVANGKSTAGIARLLILASRYPRSRWVVFRQEYKTLMQTTRKTFEKMCPPKWMKRDVADETNLINDAQILWMHLDEMDEASLRSLEINGAFGDQIEEIHPEMWELLDSRIGRWQLPEWGRRCPPYIWGTSNPEGHDWVYYRFHPDCYKYQNLQTERKNVIHPATKKPISTEMTWGHTPQRAYYFSDTLANIDRLTEIDPSYVRNLLAKPKSWQDKWVFGNRSIFEGMIHRDWNNQTHTYDSREFDLFKQRRIRSIWGYFDYGLSHPTTLELVATDNEGFSFFFREYGDANRKISEHAQEILKIQQETQQKTGLRVEGIYADPMVFYESTRDRTVETVSVADEYTKFGIYFLQADNNEDSSIERLNEFLKVDPSRINPITKQSGSPKVFFSKDCPQVIEQIQQQRWKKKKNLLTGENEFVEERSTDIPDDFYDDARYWANSRTDYQAYRGPIKTHSTTYGRAVNA